MNCFAQGEQKKAAHADWDQFRIKCVWCGVRLRSIPAKMDVRMAGSDRRIFVGGGKDKSFQWKTDDLHIT
jgi:hypothetical protein